jgi:hypothetical protein
MIDHDVLVVSARERVRVVARLIAQGQPEIAQDDLIGVDRKGYLLIAMPSPGAAWNSYA